MYGCGENERLVGQAIRRRRDEVVLATKFGNVRDEKGVFWGVNGRPEYVRECCEASLLRLGAGHIDLARDIAGLEQMWRRDLLPEHGNLPLIASAAGYLPPGLNEDRDHGAAKSTGAAGDDDGF